MKKVYLAGPITGLPYETVTEWRDYARVRLRLAGAEALDPMRGKEELKGLSRMPQKSGVRYCSPHEILHRDFNDVSSCDLVLANFSDARVVSIGTVVEFGWAFALRKPVVLVMPQGNPHEHPFIAEIAAIRCETLQAGLEAVEFILNLNRE